MSMTQEEAIKHLLHDWHINLGCDFAIKPGRLDDFLGALDVALSALRPITREQVEKVKGEWIIEDVGDGDRRKKCSMCNQPISGWWGRDRFCANCGSPMTDEAVEIRLKELEALHGEKESD